MPSASSGLVEICRATWSARLASIPRCRSMVASSSRSASGWISSSCRSLRTSASTSSFCEETETYSPVAIEKAPAARLYQAGEDDDVLRPAAPPTPAIRETLVTRPSMAPKHGRGAAKPPETSRCS
mgnify:CR=1 FL=1